MMVLMAKLPSKLLPRASVYRPTAQVHAANDALVVRGYKHTRESPAMPTQTPSRGPGSMAAKAWPGPHTRGRPRSSGNGSGRVLGPKRTFASPRPIPSKPENRACTKANVSHHSRFAVQCLRLTCTGQLDGSVEYVKKITN